MVVELKIRNKPSKLVLAITQSLYRVAEKKNDFGQLQNEGGTIFAHKNKPSETEPNLVLEDFSSGIKSHRPQFPTSHFGQKVTLFIF